MDSKSLAQIGEKSRGRGLGDPVSPSTRGWMRYVYNAPETNYVNVFLQPVN